MSDEHVDKIEAVLPGRWDLPALRAGAAVCAVFGIPFFLLALVLDSDSSAVDFGLFMCFLAAFVVGSGCAAWVQRAGTPFSHAVVTALGAYAAIAVLVMAIRFVRGSPLGFAVLLSSMPFVSITGVIGGFLGSRLQAQGMRPSSRL